MSFRPNSDTSPLFLFGLSKRKYWILLHLEKTIRRNCRHLKKGKGKKNVTSGRIEYLRIYNFPCLKCLHLFGLGSVGKLLRWAWHQCGKYPIFWERERETFYLSMNNAHVIVQNGRKVGGQTITGSLLKHGQRMCVCVFLNFHKYLELAQFSIPIASFFAVDAIDDRAEDGFLRRRFRVHLCHDGNESGRKKKKTR